MAVCFRTLWRLIFLLLLALCCLQLYFVLRIAVMGLVIPSSTAFQRAQLISLAQQGQWTWNQETVAGSAINDSLRRAVIASEDADSYRYHIDETVVNLTGSGTLIIENDFMPVVPVITTTAETALSWSIGSDTFRKSLSAGTWTLPEFELQAGRNTVTIKGTGTTTFRFREGRL